MSVSLSPSLLSSTLGSLPLIGKFFTRQNGYHPLAENVPGPEVAIDMHPHRNTGHLKNTTYAGIIKQSLELFRPDPPVPSGTYTAQAFFNRQDLILNKLSERTLTDATGRILTAGEGKDGIPSAIKDEKTWKDLALIAGSEETPDGCVAAKVDRTATRAGSLFLKGRLARPTDDVGVIGNRQRLIREFSDEALSRDLAASFQKLKENELHMVSFWNPKGQMLPGRFDKNFCRLAEWLDPRINGSPKALTLVSSVEAVKSLISTATVTAAAVAMPLYALSLTGLFGQGAVSSSLEHYNNRFSAASGPLYLAASFLPSIAKGAMSLFGGAMAAMMTPGTWEWNRIDLNFDLMVHKKMLSVARYFRSMEQIYNRLKDTDVAARLEHFDKLDAFMNNPKLQTLFSTLKSRTFDGETGYLYQRGNVLYAWRQLENGDVKKEFERSITAIAEIDATLGTAKLFRESPGAYCLPEFVTDSATPEVELADYWHPIVGKEASVLNSIRLGEHLGAPNVIVTGPNAAGKSTGLRSITTAILMGQSLGIAPARKMRLTPFSTIQSSMQTTDNVGDGDSLFAAQVKFADRLIGDLKKSDRFTWCVVDELFNGTNPEDGPAFAEGTAKVLGQFRNNILMYATHFPNASDLEERTDRFVNYRVSLDDATQHPTYRLERGRSKVFAGLTVAKRMQFDPEALEAVEEAKARIRSARTRRDPYEQENKE